MFGTTLSKLLKSFFSNPIFSDEWTKNISTNSARYYAAGVQLTEQNFWILGGNDASSWLSTTEVCNPSSGCSEFVDLPEVSFVPQAVRFNSSHIFVLPRLFPFCFTIGLSQRRRKVWKVNAFAQPPGSGESWIVDRQVDMKQNRINPYARVLLVLVVLPLLLLLLL